MFKCDQCGTDSVHGETPVRMVIATRRREYPAFQRSDGTLDHGGMGIEIAQEAVVHERCAGALQTYLASLQPPIAYTDAAAVEQPFNTLQVA